MLTQNAFSRERSVKMQQMLFMTFLWSQYRFSWPILYVLSGMSYIIALLTYLTDPSSLSIPNVYLTPHASRCDEAERPALSWCSVHELDILYMYVYTYALVMCISVPAVQHVPAQNSTFAKTI